MRHNSIAGAVLCLIFCAAAAPAQKYHLVQTVTGAGGGTMAASGGYTMAGTAGQPAAATSSSDDYSGGGGFWEEYPALVDYFVFTYALTDGWNLLSVGQNVPDFAAGALFPGAGSDAYTYAGNYKARDTLAPGTGYWLKFNGEQTAAVLGIPRPGDTIPVNAGWNIIGSIGSPIATAAIIQLPSEIVVSNYLGYVGAYAIASSISPGLGYWVKASAAGQLVLNASASAVPAAGAAAAAQDGELNTLTFRAAGVPGLKSPAQQRLLFGSGTGPAVGADFFALPPPPPAGGFDVRFASNMSAWFLGGEAREAQIAIASDGGPITVSWTMKEQSGTRYSLVEKLRGKTVTSHRLTSDGSVTIRPSAGTTYALRAERMPHRYALHQNYPNPFNPSTTVRFDLPEAAIVDAAVFDILGRNVATLLPGTRLEEGEHAVSFDAAMLASGTYFCRITASGLASGKRFHDIRKMTLLR